MKATTRINLEVSHELKRIIYNAKLLTEAASITEVIKRAISLYKLVYEESRQGSKIVIHKKNGTTETIVIL